MDALDVGRAHLVGNSMGGRVAVEVGLRAPERVAGLALLAPAVAFVKRDWHPVVRLMRPELGLLPHNLGRARVARQFWSLFADPDQVDPSVADLVVDEFQRIYASAGRAAGLPHRGAQHLPRAPLRARRLLPAAGGARGARRCSCGAHATASSRRGSSATWPSGCPTPSRSCSRTAATCPQVERSEQTIGLLRRFFERVDALGPRRARARAA